MKELTHDDKIKLLSARIRRASSVNRISKKYSFPKGDLWWKVTDDHIKALAENNDCDRETNRRYGI